MIKNPHRTQAFADWISVQAHRVAGMPSLNGTGRQRLWHPLMMSFLPPIYKTTAEKRYLDTIPRQTQSAAQALRAPQRIVYLNALGVS